jgi:anti-anti-sigma factor
MIRPPTLKPPAAESSGDVTVFTFSAPAVRDEEDMLGKELRGLADDLDGRHLLLNFANVRGIYSVEIGTLISLHKRLRAAGGRLTLFGLSAAVYEVLDLMRLDGYLDICRAGDVEDAFLAPAPGA